MDANQIVVDEQPATSEPGFTHVKVTNHNDFDLEDRYDNQPFLFPSQKTVTVPLGVAQHIFGLGRTEMEAKLYCMKRFGWNTPAMVQDAKNEKYFNNLEIRPVRFQLVEVPAHVLAEADPQPARAPQRGRPRKAVRGWQADIDDVPAEDGVKAT